MANSLSSKRTSKQDLAYLLSSDEMRVVDAYLHHCDLDKVAEATRLDKADVRSIMRRSNVKEEIRRRMDQVAVNSHETVFLISEIARLDPTQLMKCYKANPETGKRNVDVAEIERRGLGRFVERIDTDAYGNETIRWYSRTRAIEQMAKIHKLGGELHVHINPESARKMTDEELERALKEVDYKIVE